MSKYDVPTEQYEAGEEAEERLRCSALGNTQPDPYSRLLGTGYRRFLAPSGCHGLAKVDGKAVEILAVGATEAGKGQFRTFIADCKRDFAEVRVLEIWNPDVSAALTRYGFVPFTESRDLEVIEGMKWPSPLAPMPVSSGGSGT